MRGYTKADMSLWHGRTDSETDYRSFRWHQNIQSLDLMEKIEPAQSKLCFVLIGYKVDQGIKLNGGRLGAVSGPDKVREFLCNKPCSFPQDVKLFDAGDVNYETSVGDAQNTLSILVKKCLEHNYFPIVIGGGHDVSYGTMSAVIDFYPVDTKNLGIINFDAHFDLRPYTESTSGTMFHQIYDDLMEANACFNHITIGIQKSGNTISLFDFAKSIKSKYILAGELTLENKAINNYKIQQFIEKQDLIYVTICSDVFASPYAPGVSSPQPLGITPEIALELLKLVLSTKKVIAFDIGEISPTLDTSNSTASLGALIIYTVVNHLGEISNHKIRKDI